MDPLTMFEDGDDIPMYNRNGRAYTPEERAAIAKRRGQCVKCGVKTHKVSVWGRKPLTDENVYQGICIRCHPDDVPKAISEDWERKNKKSDVTFQATARALTAAAAMNARMKKKKAQQQQIGSQPPARVGSGGGSSSDGGGGDTADNNTIDGGGGGGGASAHSSSHSPQIQRRARQTLDGTTAEPPPLSPSPDQQQSSPHRHGGIFSQSASEFPAISPLTSADAATLLRSNSSSSPGSSRLAASVSALDLDTASPLPRAGGRPRMPRHEGGVNELSMDSSERSVSSDQGGGASCAGPSIRLHGSSSRMTSTSNISTNSLRTVGTDVTTSGVSHPVSNRGINISTTSISSGSHQQQRNRKRQPRHRPTGSWMHDYTGGIGGGGGSCPTGLFGIGASSSKSLTSSAFPNLQTLDTRKLIQTLHQIRNRLNAEEASEFLHQAKPLLIEEDERVLMPLCGALWRCSAVGDDHAHQLFMNHGGFDFLMETLKSLSRRGDDAENYATATVELVEVTVGALTSLIRGSLDRTASFVQTGGIEAVLSTLYTYSQEPHVLEWVSKCVICLVSLVDDKTTTGTVRAERETLIEKHIALMEGSGGVNTIFRCVKKQLLTTTATPGENDWGPHVWGLTAIWSLLEHAGNKSTRDRILQVLSGQEGFIVIASRLFQADVGGAGVSSSSKAIFECRIIAWDILGALLEKNRGNDDGGLYAAAACCIPRMEMVQLKRGDDDGARRFLGSGYRFLWAFAHGAEAVREAMFEHNVVEELVISMESLIGGDGNQNISRNSSLLTSAAWILWKFSASDDCCYTSAGQVQSALLALSKTIEAQEREDTITADLLLPTIGFMGNSCTVPGVNAGCFPLQIIGKTLACFPDNLDLQKEAIQALSNVCFQFPSEVSRELGDVVHHVSAVLNGHSLVEKSHVCLLLACIAYHSEASRQIMITSGTLPATSALLEETTDAPEVVSAALDLLTALLALDDNRSIQMPVQDIIQTLISLASSERLNGSLRCKSFTTLRSVVLSCASIQPDMVARLIEFLTTTVGSGSVVRELRQEACAVIWAFTFAHPIPQTESLITTFIVLVELIKKYQGDQGLPFVRETYAVATGALVGVSRRLLEHDQPMVNDIQGRVDIVVEGIYTALGAATRGSEEVEESIENLLDAVLCLCQINADAVIQTGGIVAVIDAMVEHETKAGIQEKACAVLAYLSSSESLQVILSIVQTDGIDLLISAQVAFPDNAKIRCETCMALSHLSIDDESRMLIMSQGGIELILQAMKSSPDNCVLQERACTTLLNLTSDANSDDIIANASIAEVIVKAMKDHSRSDTLQEKALGILLNIATKSRALKDEIGVAGGIEIIVEAIDKSLGVPTVLERAFSALWSLSLLEDNRDRLLTMNGGGGVDLVVNGMLAAIEYEKVQKQGCGCLCALASNARNKAIIRESGGVNAVVYSAWAHFEREDILTKACAALANLASSDYEIQENEVSAVVTAMERFPRSEELQAHGCRVFLNYLPSPRNISVMSGSAEQIGSVASVAASSFPDRCSHQAMQVLSYLCT